MPPQDGPIPAACNPSYLQAMDSSVCVIGMMDGSCRNLSPGIDPNIWWALCTPNGGEVISGDN